MIICTFEKGYTAKLRHIVLHGVVDLEGKILLVKRTGDLLETGKWGFPGGFLERDETASEGMLRELKEETGWEGEVISLFRINTKPNRPHEDRQNVALDFLITPTRQTGKPDSESSQIRWFPIEDLPAFNSLAFDHGESLKRYLEYRKNPFPLPLVD